MCRLKLAGARGTVGVCGLKVPSLILPGHGFADPQHDFTELKLNFTEPGNGFTELKHNFTEPQHDFTVLHMILPFSTRFCRYVSLLLCSGLRAGIIITMPCILARYIVTRASRRIGTTQRAPHSMLISTRNVDLQQLLKPDGRSWR